MGAIGHVIRRHASVASTNDLAAELARAGCEEGVAVVAQRQFAGRGQHGHAWASPEGGLYLSVVLRPQVPPERVHCFGFAAAIAVCEAARELFGLKLNTRWPNDLLLGRRKVGGILVETHTRERDVDFVVVGIGVNVNTDLSLLPAGLRELATSLAAELGGPVDIEAFLQRILSIFEKLYRGMSQAEILQRWTEWAAFIGRRVRVEDAVTGSAVTGLADGVDPTGRLILRTDEGSRRLLSAGSVRVLE